MALSAKAEVRKAEIKLWIRNNLDNPNLIHYTRVETTRGKLNLARIWMLGGLALSNEFGTPGNMKHILESDNAWRIIARELRIHPSTFYNYMDEITWDAAYEADLIPMTTHFYRSKLLAGSPGFPLILPEQVESFPPFPGYQLAPDVHVEQTTGGVEQGLYPADAVLRWIGRVGGVATGDVKGSGILTFSNDKVLKSALLRFGRRGGTYFQSVAASKTGGNIAFYWSAQNLHLSISPSDPAAQVEFVSEQAQDFPNDGTDLTFIAKVIAEDDTEQTYTWTVVDS